MIVSRMLGMNSIKYAVAVTWLCTCAVLLTDCCIAAVYLFCWLKLLLCLQYVNTKMNNGRSTATTRVQDVVVDVSVVVECTCGVALLWHYCS